MRDPRLTNMSDFASGPAISTLGGQVRNPHAPDRSPASSSGGSGAAVAARFAGFALGTDTGGSIRGPASANGIAGLRPTYGLIGRGGIIPLALSLDTVSRGRAQDPLGHHQAQRGGLEAAVPVDPEHGAARAVSTGSCRWNPWGSAVPQRGVGRPQDCSRPADVDPRTEAARCVHRPDGAAGTIDQ